MPLSTALPPPQIDVIDSWYYPMRNVGDGKGAAMSYNAHANMRGSLIGGLTASEYAFGTYGASGGTGSTTQLVGGEGGFMPPGRQESVRVVTTVSVAGGGMKPPLIHESYGPAADWDPGAFQAPASVVSVYGVTWANSDGVDNWPDDSTGFCFVPNTAVATDALRIGSGPMSGFGLFLNSNGAGGVQLDYLAWDAAVVVERVTLGAAVIPDFTVWNSARFIIISAANGREASVSIEVNSTSFLTRNFGGGANEIRVPSAQSATALQYVFANVARLGGGAFYSFIAYGYDGRFNPAGQELQPFGS